MVNIVGGFKELGDGLSKASLEISDFGCCENPKKKKVKGRVGF